MAKNERSGALGMGTGLRKVERARMGVNECSRPYIPELHHLVILNNGTKETLMSE